MKCLEDIRCGKRTIIGIRDYDGCNKPESNLWINDGPGITLKSAAAIANEEQRSGYELLKSNNIRAVEYVFEDFYAKATGLYRFNAVAETRRLNYWDGSKLPATALDRGLVLKRWRSEMAQIFISELYIKSASSGTASVKIQDIILGEDGTVTVLKTTTVSVDLVADKEVTKRVDYISESEQVLITIDNTSFSMYSGNVDTKFSGCGGCSGTPRGLYFNGWNGSAEQNRYFGIGALASVRCYEENILCQLLPRMNFIIYYRAQIMFWDNLLYSNRLNPITTYNEEKAKAAKAELEKKYDKAFNAFIPVIKGFIGSMKGDCFTCNSSIRHANSLRV